MGIGMQAMITTLPTLAVIDMQTGMAAVANLGGEYATATSAERLLNAP